MFAYYMWFSSSQQLVSASSCIRESRSLRSEGEYVFSSSGILFLPTFKSREKQPHHSLILFHRHRFRHILIHFIHELRAEVYHLLHRAIICERTVFVAVYAIVFVLSPVCVGAILPTSSIRSSFSASTPLGANARQEYLRVRT